MTAKRLGAVRSVLGVVFLAVGLLAAAVTDALANGAGLETYRGRAGGYELVVRVQPELPMVGALHLTFTLLDVRSLEPVLDATVTVVARDDSGVERYQARAVNTPAERKYYDANLTIESPGQWTLLVDVRSDERGAAKFSVPLTVGGSAPGLYGGGFVVWVLTVAVLVGGGSVVWWRGSRGRGADPAG